MGLESELAAVAEFAPEDVGDLRRNIDSEWVESALQATGTATIRTRRLPAESVIWLIIGMALLRRRSIVSVAETLGLVLPGTKRMAAPSSVAQSRVRVGEEPLDWLFNRCAEHWAHKSAATDRWRGLALYAIDGTKLRAPDTAENYEAFGKHRGGPGESAYPMLRMVALMALRSHLIAAVQFGPYEVSEQAYAAEVWASVPSGSLVILDRLYFSAAALMTLAATGNRHWLLRAKKNLSYRVVEKLGRDDALVEMVLTKEAKKALTSDSRTWRARLIRCRRKGFRDQMLLTSLVDADAFPAKEFGALYHERWDIELGYDEVKTELLDSHPVLRSKSPVLVRQELWGVLLAYNLVRVEMERAAAAANVPPTRISFSSALRLICDEWIWCANSAPGAIPRQLLGLRGDLERLVLPPRRTKRTYPREVKVQRSSYPRNRRSPSVKPVK